MTEQTLVVGSIAFNPFQNARRDIHAKRVFLRDNPPRFASLDIKPKASKEGTTTEDQGETPSTQGRYVQTKTCVKCNETKPKSKFGKHESSADGHQSYCLQCRNNLQKRRRNEDPVYRLRHHISTRVGAQIKKPPKGYVADLEKYLGYTFKELAEYLEDDLREREGQDRNLIDAFNAGYHVDHILPLSSFGDLDITSRGFRLCWEMANLRAISAEENLEKGAKLVGTGP